ncbi:MAG: TRAP transporter fused permease subunit [Pseudomonadota bacterium]
MAAKLCMALVFIYHILYATAFFETVGLFLNPMRTRAISLGLITLLAFATRAPMKSRSLDLLYRIFAGLIILAGTGYIVFFYGLFGGRLGSAEGYEVFLGLLTIVIVLESTRFTSGNAFVVVTIAFVLYTILGPYLPGFFQAPPTSITLLSGQIYLGLMGIYGVTTEILLDYVFGFLVFGYVFREVGGLTFFEEITRRMFRRSRGGSAKSAIVTNLLFGMVQGSTLAAVLITGPLTIPQMRRQGYREEHMGGLIAAAADAAQLMPPVMGVVAFVMADYLAVPYIKVCVAAFFPGFLYYLSLFISSHLWAKRRGIDLPSQEKERLPAFWRLAIQYWHCIAVFILLILLLASQATTIRLAIMISTGFLLAAGSVRKKTRPTLAALRGAVAVVTKNMVAIGPTCASAGVIIACIGMTSLDYKFSAELTEFAGQNMVLLLLVATVACMILGMGLPTLPAYIVVVLLVSPALQGLGLSPIVVHMFVFYMALAAMLTPPVCLNVYAVAPMVRSPMLKIALVAVVIGAARYVIPFLFVYRPGLLMVGSPGKILEDVSIALVIILAISFAQSRYGFVQTTWLEIAAALVGAFLLFYPGGGSASSFFFGALLLLLALISQVYRFFRLRSSKIESFAGRGRLEG